MRNNLKIIFLIIKTNTHTVELLSFPPAVRFFVSLTALGVEGGVYSDIFLFSSFFMHKQLVPYFLLRAIITKGKCIQAIKRERIFIYCIKKKHPLPISKNQLQREIG